MAVDAKFLELMGAVTKAGGYVNDSATSPSRSFLLLERTTTWFDWIFSLAAQRYWVHPRLLDFVRSDTFTGWFSWLHYSLPGAMYSIHGYVESLPGAKPVYSQLFRKIGRREARPSLYAPAVFARHPDHGGLTKTDFEKAMWRLLGKRIRIGEVRRGGRVHPCACGILAFYQP
jgi:hypothetical protein